MEINKYKFVWPPKIEEMGNLVKDYIDSGNSLSIADDSGIYQELESSFARLHNRKYGLLVSSGTMALYSAFFGINLLQSDEIICTAYSYHATSAPALHFGAKIVFCDIEEDTGNIDCKEIEKLITKKTKAIISNDQWGHPCDKDKILEICKKYSIKYIEDCSHAHFAKYKDKYTGSFGDVACWSLQGNKLLSGGEGGILLTDNQDIYERAVLLGHNLKRPAQSVKNSYYKPLERTGFGLKLRIHPLAALMVNYQLKNYCFKWIESREKTLDYFNEKLEKETFFSKMVKREYVTSMGAWYGFKPLANFKELGIDKIHFVNWMKEKGFEVDIPKSEILPKYQIFSSEKYSINKFKKLNDLKEYPGANIYYERIITFPTFTFEEYGIIDCYIEAIKEYWKWVKNSGNKRSL
jgi:perosamine synthetase